MKKKFRTPQHRKLALAARRAKQARSKHIYGAQKLNTRRIARAVKRAQQAKPRKRAMIPVIDMRLRMARGNYAVAILLAHTSFNFTRLRLELRLVQSNSMEYARSLGIATLQAEDVRNNNRDWNIVETCVQSVNI